MKNMKKAFLMLTLAGIIGMFSFPAFAAWQKEGDSYVYYEKDGTKAANMFKKSGDQWFYLDENGNLVKNCEREIEGKIYTFDENGACDMQNVRDAGTSADEITGKNQWTKDNYQTSTEFVAISGRQQYLNQTANPYTDNSTVQWFNATYAILTRYNTENIKAFGGSLLLDGIESGGAEVDAFTRNTVNERLKKYWSVTDRASADQVLGTLVQAGNETGSAWDFSRAMSNLGYYYIAGIYTKEEALDKALETAMVIQTKFTSWDEFAGSYLAGYEAWSGDTTGERRTLYDNLKASKFNPYALDWNLKLEKSW